MKLRTLFVCLLCLYPALLPAQTIDFNAVRSAEQLRAGVQAFHRGFYNDASISLEKAISYQPANARAQIWLGRAQWKSGYEQEALRTWQQVLDSGRGSALVRDWVDVLTLRRGLGAELAGKSTWVVSAELDGTLNGGYPFKRPTSIRPRADGTFWLVAFGSNEILHFDANFRLLEAFRGGLPGFDRPYDVVEADDGTLYVSEYGANRISRLQSPRRENRFFRPHRKRARLPARTPVPDPRPARLPVGHRLGQLARRPLLPGRRLRAGDHRSAGSHGHRRRRGPLVRLRQARQAHPRVRSEREPTFLDRRGNPSGSRGAFALGHRIASRGGRKPHPRMRPRARDLDCARRYERAHQEAGPAGVHREWRRSRCRLRPEQGRAPLRRHHAVLRAGRAGRPGELREVSGGVRGRLGGEQVRQAGGGARRRELHRHGSARVRPLSDPGRGEHPGEDGGRIPSSGEIPGDGIGASRRRTGGGGALRPGHADGSDHFRLGGGEAGARGRLRGDAAAFRARKPPGCALGTLALRPWRPPGRGWADHRGVRCAQGDSVLHQRRARSAAVHDVFGARNRRLPEKQRHRVLPRHLRVPAPDDDLSYLASATGGKITSISAPGGHAGASSATLRRASGRSTRCDSPLSRRQISGIATSPWRSR